MHQNYIKTRVTLYFDGQWCRGDSQKLRARALHILRILCCFLGPSDSKRERYHGNGDDSESELDNTEQDMHNVKQEPTDGDNSYFDQSYDQSGYGHNMPQGSFSSPNNESLPGTSYAAQPGQMMANMSQAGTGEDGTPGSMVGGICCIFFNVLMLSWSVL